MGTAQFEKLQDTQEIQFAPRLQVASDPGDSIVEKHERIAEELGERLRNLGDGETEFYWDPYGTAPLSVIGLYNSGEPTRVVVDVYPEFDFSKRITKDLFDGNYYTHHYIPLLGSVAGERNALRVTFYKEDGTLYWQFNRLWTAPYPDNFATIDVSYPAKKDKLGDGVYFVGGSTSRPAAINYDGKVVWFWQETESDYIPTGVASYFPRLNGRILLRATNEYTLLEVDMTGRVYKVSEFSYYVHHDVVEIEDGIMLIQSEDDIGTRPWVEDWLTLYNYDTGENIEIIDFKDILDVDRPQMPFTIHGLDPTKIDWLHENSVEFHEPTNVYITSSRHQNCVFAIDRDSKDIRWILGTHWGWKEEYRPFLLTPVDENGNPLYDLSTPEGQKECDNHFWQWAQHSAKIYTNTGNPDTIDIFLFDNGNYRSYEETWWYPTYENGSRGVLYRVNHREMTVQLLWEFGRELGQKYFSAYIGNITYFPETSSAYMNFGGTNYDFATGHNVGIEGDFPIVENYQADTIRETNRVLEVDIATNEILFGFDLYNPDRPGIYKAGIYRGMKNNLYTGITRTGFTPD